MAAYRPNIRTSSSRYRLRERDTLDVAVHVYKRNAMVVIRSMPRKTLLNSLVLLVGVVSYVTALSMQPTDIVPQKSQRIAWAWDEAQVPDWSMRHVAVVVRHILLRDQAVLQRPRTSSPKIAATTLVTPVVHVEISSVHPPVDITQSRPLIVKAMRQAAHMSTSGWVQLDMEARPSQRDYYKELVREIRSVLPAEVKLSVTALAWWCRSDQWFNDLAADEIVPMFFRMGADSSAMRQTLESGAERMHPTCRTGVAGFSRQEPVPAVVLQRYSKTYWFDNQRWHSQ